ncbi:pilus assembly protein TadG-related protein [Aurantiacibacter sp. MUD11]|uniref:pilus assembly protein TadG-related protein n=1 Tax=Aurantiacibacter sp. MUD11 TaxID=3003265 RepID=UPI0022AB1B83|nr:pilus assembly protein TadG-related protein [Aurantiacibacter sp. MUD11]WAT16711.1 pilus assembly protein TadG-related protein [Aurantiacibacter sp. MUD11]
MRLARENLRQDADGSVAPLYAMALFALIAIAGIGLDYGRLVTMQSELQNAADQAALAAATQLDSRPGAIARAEAAARNYFDNETRVANDDAGPTVDDFSLTFYDGYANDQPGAVTSDDESAKVVQVHINGREVFYALTPVVGAMSSGDITADAMAMLEQAVCNLPPIMVCIERSDFFLPTLEGYGLRMRWLPSSGIEPLAAGNFGFLDLYGEHDSQYELGENNAYASCGPMENVTTEPGFRSTETRALNTRFDIYANPLSCDPANGDFCPSQNTGKNLVLEEESTITTNSPVPPSPPPCGTFERQSRGWEPMTTSGTPNEVAIAGSFTPDECFADGTCTYMGDGDWDLAGYLARNHPGVSPASFAKGTRYEVYQWELEDPANRLAPRLVSSEVDTRERGNSGQYEHTFTNRCTYPQPVYGTPLAPSATQKDRRLLSVAAVDCTGLNGRSPVDILGWLDVFLIQPGDDTETIQSEIVGPALRPDNLPTFQYFGRHRAVLIR